MLSTLLYHIDSTMLAHDFFIWHWQMWCFQVFVIYLVHVSDAVVIANLFGGAVDVFVIGLNSVVLLLDQILVLVWLGTMLSRNVQTRLHFILICRTSSSIYTSFLIMSILKVIPKIIIMSWFINGICLMWHHVWLFGLEEIIITILSSMTIDDLCGSFFTPESKTKGLYSIGVVWISSSSFGTVIGIVFV